MSLTDEICNELWEGLEKGLDWSQFLAKRSNSKGPLYTAIGKFFDEIGIKILALKEEESSVQNKVKQSGLELDSLQQKIKDCENKVTSLEGKKDALNEEVAALDAKLTEKSELMKQTVELAKLGFNAEALKQLKEVLTDIGVKSGLKPKEAVSKFFADLKDYDDKVGFEQEVHRLETIASTKKLEAEKWQAEADSLSRHYKDLSDAIAALQNLFKLGIKTDEVISWNALVSKVGGPDELKDKLGQYKTLSELLSARKKEADSYDKKVKELNAQIKALDEQKLAIEGAIKTLSASGVKKITRVSDKAITGLNSLSASGLKQVNMVSTSTITEIKSLMVQLSTEVKALNDLKTQAGKLEKELIYARYLTTGDESILKSFPKEIVVIFLERALIYCKLNQLNPMVRVPDDFTRKYPIIYSSTEIALIDLIRWAETGLAGASK